LRPGAPRDSSADAASGAFRPDESVSLATAGKSRTRLARRIENAFDGICPCTGAPSDEPNLDGSGDRCYEFAAVTSSGDPNFMKNRETGKKRPSFWQTFQAASGPYLRLYGYVKPYKARFVLGLSLGFAFGMVNSLFPLVVARVTSVIFHGAAPNPMALRSNLEVLNAGPKINSLLLICLAIPAIMIVGSPSTYCNPFSLH